MSLEQPILWLGLAGFPADRALALQQVLSRRGPGWPQWRLAPFGDADAWWVHGPHIRLLKDGTLKVRPGDAGQSGVQLHMDQVNRPIAFSLPLAAPEFEPSYTFDPDSELGLFQVLQQFEAWLRPLRSQFALAAQLLAREGQLQSGVFHFNHRGNLLAVVDLETWTVALSPAARPVDMGEANMDKRPAAAKAIPPGFLKTSLAAMMWSYTQRTLLDVLPQRYRSRTIYLKRPPPVPADRLRDSHLALLRELSVGPSTFDALRQRTGLPAEQLARDLASFYFAGCITSTRRTAQAVAARHANQRPTPEGVLTGQGQSMLPEHLMAPSLWQPD